MAIGEPTQSTQMPRKNQGDSTGGLTVIRFVNTVVISETASQYANNQSVKMQQMDTPTHCTPDSFMLQLKQALLWPNRKNILGKMSLGKKESEGSKEERNEGRNERKESMSYSKNLTKMQRQLYK